MNASYWKSLVSAPAKKQTFMLVNSLGFLKPCTVSSFTGETSQQPGRSYRDIRQPTSQYEYEIHDSPPFFL